MEVFACIVVVFVRMSSTVVLVLKSGSSVSEYLVDGGLGKFVVNNTVVGGINSNVSECVVNGGAREHIVTSSVSEFVVDGSGSVR